MRERAIAEHGCAIACRAGLDQNVPGHAQVRKVSSCFLQALVERQAPREHRALQSGIRRRIDVLRVRGLLCSARLTTASFNFRLAARLPPNTIARAEIIDDPLTRVLDADAGVLGENAREIRSQIR